MWDDYRPLVYKTTDFGKHWSVATNGLPDDQSVFIVREDPDDPSLLFLGNANSIYVSFDAGAQWRPLGMGLPHAQVRDIAIDSRQGEVVAATHGRSFWILDNLSLLEQWARDPNPPADAAKLYAPQSAWLTHTYGKSDKAEYREPVGANPPYGATVFFRLPATYDGKTPASLEILDDQGHAIRHYTLHLKKKQKKLPRTVEDNLQPSQEKRNAVEKLTAISPGMNSLQWNLRYDDATDVIGFEPPEETDDVTADASGPVVNPGRYTVVLHYGGNTYRQPFQVSLDPRLYTTPAALKQHLALQLELHQTIDSLDRTLNAAIDTRQRLTQAVAARKVDASTAAPALDALHEAIDNLVQLNVRSSEGDVLHEMHLRSLLAYMQANVSLDYGPPDASMIAECKGLEADARSGEAKLRAATAAGQHLL
jgi:chorismate mutase